MTDTTNIFSDLDPDEHYSPIINCKYFSYTELESLRVSGGALALFHANIRSAVRNLQTLTDLIATTQCEFSVIGLTETWLNSTTRDASLYTIPNYRQVSITRPSRTGGGVSLHILNTLAFRERMDLSNCTDDYETLFIEMFGGGSTNIIVGAIYKPPAGCTSAFIEYLNITLTKIHSEKKVAYRSYLTPPL